MARVSRFALLLLVLAPACDDDGAAVSDGGFDADTTGDITADPTPDLLADALPDAATETSDEPQPDALPDAPDAAPDLDPDAPITLDLVAGCNPFASTDECFFPYPSSAFQEADATTPTGVRLAYHQEIVDLPPSADELDFTAFNRADGAPPVGPLFVHFGVDVHPDRLVDLRHPEDSAAADAPIALFDMDNGVRIAPLLTEMDENRRDGQWEGRHALIIRPLTPMTFGARHVAVLTTDLTDVDGNPLPSPPAFAALRDGIATTNPEIEAMRADYEDLFDFLEEHGYAREEILLAWDFHVASRESVLGPILSMREQTFAEIEAGITYTIDDVEDDPNANVARIVEGTFEVPTFLDENNDIQFDEDGLPILQDPQSFNFTMIIPPDAADGPLPVGVVGHGIFGNGRDMLTDSNGVRYIQPIAAQIGTVLVATDWIGLSDGDLQLILDEVLPDLNRISLITDRLQQSLINTLVLTELAVGALADDAQVRLGDDPVVDATQVNYFGGSLGGIQGASFVSLSPRVERAVLAVPGGGWTHMINRSTVFAPIKQLTDLTYPDPLLQQVFLAVVQGRFDHSDPINLSFLWSREPLEDAPENRIALLQEAIGDCLVPNLTTRILARAMDVVQLTPAVEAVWGLEPVTGPTTRSALGQLLLPDNLADYAPPDTNVLPAEDNGVHFEAVIHEKNIQMVLNLFATGEIEQFCEDSCDPD